MTAGSSAPAPPLPGPPSPLACNLLTLPAGTIVHRIHDSRFSAADFNPGLGASRFAPIATGVGVAIPTSYAATSFGCAAYETVFHDIDPRAAFKSVSWVSIERLLHSTVELRRAVRLARMFSADLMKWGLARTELIDTPPARYPETRLWSAAVHESDASIDGMMWTSRAYDEEKAMLLFGTRLTSADLIPRTTVQIVTDAATLKELHRLARMSGILISR